MIYILAVTFIGLSHVIYYYGRKGNRIAIGFEKIVVIVAAISLLMAIFYFCKNFPRYLSLDDSNMMMGYPVFLLYPVGIIVFVVAILRVFPKPIKQASRSNKACRGNPPGAPESKN